MVNHVNKDFICPHCKQEAVKFHYKLKAYLTFWQKITCSNCKKKLLPNLLTRKIIWCCFGIGLLLDILLTAMTPWDRMFDLLFGMVWAIPFFLHYPIFADIERRGGSLPS